MSQSDNAEHRSAVLSALERGYLGALTLPLHRFLIEDQVVIAGLSRDHRAELTEKWMYFARATERHKESARFFGYLGELGCAQWLEAFGWDIVDVAAAGGPHDVLANNYCGKAAFEVKFISEAEWEFEMGLASLRTAEPVAVSASPYAPVNYLLFRVYEAAWQLRTWKGPRIAVILFDELSWQAVDFKATSWIDWRAAKFYEGDHWTEFYRKREAKGRYRGMRERLQMAVNSLSEVWIMVRGEGWRYEQRLRYVLPATAMDWP